ncbi:unnamed protein product [Penicillium camemberti]|uniref:Str. FM013 n=1 Tax=Penicillium camemberti (strain FM 013) TaxID=1429867 RepID=A0A0G4PQX0_PENC3|nr:unnamed protein product [Penicillium camemberti]
MVPGIESGLWKFVDQGFENFLEWCIDKVRAKQDSAHGHFRHAGLNIEVFHTKCVVFCPLCRQRFYYLRKPRTLTVKEARSAGYGPSSLLVGHNSVHRFQIVKAWFRRTLSGSLVAAFGSRGGS